MLIENNHTFLSELTRMFTLSREKGGSMYITLKRLNEKPAKKEVVINKKGKSNSKKVKQSKLAQSSTTVPSSSSSSQEPESQETRCMIRVQNGKRKISTIVQAKDLDDFRTVYGSLLRGNFLGLKKRDKKKTTKKTAAVTATTTTTTTTTQSKS